MKEAWSPNEEANNIRGEYLYGGVQRIEVGSVTVVENHNADETNKAIKTPNDECWPYVIVDSVEEA